MMSETLKANCPVIRSTEQPTVDCGQFKTKLGNLGKATRRGIRKCPKCGVYNGTRCLSCKNEKCGLILKVPKEKNQIHLEVEAVKLVGPSNVQIYSVVQKDITEVHRCFVHLPIIEGIEALQDETEIRVIKQSAAMCYATKCRTNVVQLSTITLNFNPCHHTSSIVNCQLEAEPLLIKKTVVDVLLISEEIKQEICLLIAGTVDHLVQRISKSTMVVKYDDANHPLGYLHFCIHEPWRKLKKYRVLCECQKEQKKPYIPKGKKMCIHFYLCICAIASDLKLWSEFNSFIQQVLKFEGEGSVDKTEKIVVGLESDWHQFNPSEGGEVIFKKPKIENPNVNNQISLPPSLQFEDWLASVTENINQTMHYQFDGSPEPLVFQVPQAFFDVLQDRITAGSKKKRLPNSVIAILRKDSPPIGVFSKYSYEITNVLHVKRIFNTDQVPLEITRSFIDNKDGTFSPYKPELVELGNVFTSNYKMQSTLSIKPAELKTFLKIGIMSLHQKEPTPFIIEWIPDILPLTHVGELTIKFQYGHQKNGIIQKKN